MLLYVGHANEVVYTTNFNVNDSYLLNNKDMYSLGCAVGCSLVHTMKVICRWLRSFRCQKKKDLSRCLPLQFYSSTPPMFMQRQLNDVIINTNKTLTIGEIFKKVLKILILKI